MMNGHIAVRVAVHSQVLSVPSIFRVLERQPGRPFQFHTEISLASQQYGVFRPARPDLSESTTQPAPLRKLFAVDQPTLEAGDVSRTSKETSRTERKYRQFEFMEIDPQAADLGCIPVLDQGAHELLMAHWVRRGLLRIRDKNSGVMRFKESVVIQDDELYFMSGENAAPEEQALAEIVYRVTGQTAAGKLVYSRLPERDAISAHNWRQHLRQLLTADVLPPQYEYASCLKVDQRYSSSLSVE
jgi:hypothetical protein